jgi:Galactose oxidase, central domain/Kelch motif
MLRPRQILLLALLALAGCNPLDPNAPAWHQVDASPLRGRWGHVAVVDESRDRMLVFGGEDNGTKLADLWALDLATLTWTQIDAPGPGPRTDLAAVIDPLRDRLILIGGRVGLATSIDEIWALDLKSNQWTQLPSGPSARHDIQAVTDGTHAWVFGGAGSLFQSLDDLWEMDFATDSWRQLPAIDVRPKARTSAALAFFNGFVYLKGGHDVWHVTGDTWRYDLAAQSWSLVQATGGTAAGAHFGYAFDPVCSTLFVSGGDNLDNQNLAFTDALVLSGPPRFARLPSSTLPPPRDHPTLVFDSQRRRLLVYGGGSLGDGLSTRDDAWIYSLAGCP